jgi:hypothetical protein
MITARKNAILSLLKASNFAVPFSILVGLASVSGAFAVPPGQGVEPILDDDPHNCPAQYHSCGSPGLIPYFAPDPFDIGSGCDHTFLAWNSSTGQPDPSSCYGGCNVGDPTPDCYVGCQDNYSGCLRKAFSLGRRQVSLSTQNPRNTPNIAGNIYRSCLAGRIPPAFAAQYQQCRNAGGTVQECCAEIAANFP